MDEISGAATTSGRPQTSSPDALHDQATSEVLAGQVCAAASLSAQATSRLLQLLGEFDAGDAVRFQQGCGTTARWLAWACAMSPGVAREHVRVARALRRMPTLAASFAAGRLSYSKVRAATRLVEVVDETGLARLAETMTAAQLDVTVAGFRTAAGTRIAQQDKRRVSWADRGTGMVSITAQLPVEEAALVIAAIEASRDAQPVHDRCSVDALLEVARSYLTSAPPDVSGEDRTQVVVHVSAETLARTAPAPAPAPSHRADPSPASPSPAPRVVRGSSPECPEDVPAGTRTGRPDGNMRSHDRDVPAGTAPDPDDVPAGTRPCPLADPSAEGVDPSEPTAPAARSGPAAHTVAAADTVRSGTCHVPGVGPLEATTAARLACDSTLLGAVVDAHGDVLALGRTRRLVSKTQRRALMVRDRMCQYPGCHRQRHLKAHHIIAWYAGGRTDLDNLVLLCQRHHTFVHEGRLTITTTRHHLSTGRPGWRFTLPDGHHIRSSGAAEHRPGWDEPTLWKLQQQAERTARAALAGVTTMRHPAADAIVPGWRGEPFSVHDCVKALFDLQTRRSCEDRRASDRPEREPEPSAA